MAYRNKTYVAFDGDNDMRFYLLMKAWKANDNIEFDFHNAHDLNTARDSSEEESIKAQLRERLKNTKLFILLVGEHTKYLTKFVKWEIESAIRREIPIVVVNLNGIRHKDEDLCPASIDGILSLHIAYGMRIIQYAIDHWPASHINHVANGDKGAYSYKDSVYDELGV